MEEGEGRFRGRRAGPPRKSRKEGRLCLIYGAGCGKGRPRPGQGWEEDPSRKGAPGRVREGRRNPSEPGRREGEVEELRKPRTKPNTQHGESFKRSNFGSYEAGGGGVMGRDPGPSSLQTTTFPLQRDTTLRLKMAEKQLNRMIAQTLERRPRNSKVEKNVSTQRQQAERLEIPILPAGRGGEGRIRGGLSASALLSAEARPEPLRRRWWLCLSFALLLSRPRGLLRLLRNGWVSRGRRWGGEHLASLLPRRETLSQGEPPFLRPRNRDSCE